MNRDESVSMRGHRDGSLAGMLSGRASGQKNFYQAKKQRLCVLSPRRQDITVLMCNNIKMQSLLLFAFVVCDCTSQSKQASVVNVLGLDHVEIAHKIPRLPADLEKSMRQQYEEQWRGIASQCLANLGNGERRQRLLLAMAKGKLWPRAREIFLETVGVNGFAARTVLAAREGNGVTIFDVDEGNWLPVVQADPAVSGLKDRDVLAMENTAEWNIADGSCYFLSTVTRDGAIRQVMTYGIPRDGGLMALIIGNLVRYEEDVSPR